MFTSSKAVAVVVVVAELLISVLPGAYAQTSDVVCSIYNWTENSIGQTPCLVAAYLQGACNSGEYNIAALPDNQHYIGPTQAIANDCQCSTVTYNLMSACGACQNRTIIAWSSWSYNCSSVFLDVYPETIPSGTRVPAWAYLNVTNDFWDYVAAEADTAAPESTNSVQKPTGSITSSTPGSSASGSAVSGASPTSGSGTGSKTNTGAIAGGVVGGVVGAAALVGLITWFVLRRRQQQQTPASAMYDSRPMSQGPTEYSAVPPFTPSTQKFYDPSDPSTYPPTAMSPSITTGQSIMYNPSMHQGGQDTYRPGQYTGVPEL
ncbi:hypothetical protein NEOLEDRAFT_1132014 [Neolentinus lepideus HHB14362 ss-1]|uniref:Uncharacterized protein n=1 Tax=Neolentinus lepideus HHB14362 ss-1 TaxID=1314782 RepID=A0A165TDI8_9AGAM|nr:hypothetical protein NEOLEDRAFT_1132014 [Neolentinus lepideus HHB14362 ss-1]